MLEAVIFDLDGTLVDCFKVHYNAFRRVFLEGWGLDFPRRQLEEHYGKTAEDIARIFFNQQGIRDVDYDDFVAKRRQTVIENLDGNVRLLPGAVELLKALKEAGVKAGMATANTRKNGEAILKAAGIEGYFDASVYREDVENGKPHPEMFVKACRLLGVEAGDCVVVEDSVHGILAARRAGMRSVAVATGTQSRQELAGCMPDLVVDSLDEVSVDLLSRFF
jgi:HAD superfamily hydrolase (TIGR01509 family)